MKNIKIIALICLAAIWMVPRSYAQPVLSVAGTEVIGMPDTVQYGDSLKNMAVWVRNDGNLPTSNLLITVNSLINGTSQGQILGTLTMASGLLPGDSVVIPLNSFFVSPQNSNNGANVVVVWPASPGSEQGDSLEDEYYVDGVTALVGAMEEEPLISIYPNPAKDFLLLKTLRPIDGALRIFNMHGQVLYEGDTSQNRIDLKLLTPGSYILEIEEHDGPAIRKRFIKL